MGVLELVIASCLTNLGSFFHFEASTNHSHCNQRLLIVYCEVAAKYTWKGQSFWLHFPLTWNIEEVCLDSSGACQPSAVTAAVPPVAVVQNMAYCIVPLPSRRFYLLKVGFHTIPELNLSAQHLRQVSSREICVRLQGIGKPSPERNPYLGAYV